MLQKVKYNRSTNNAFVRVEGIIFLITVIIISTVLRFNHGATVKQTMCTNESCPVIGAGTEVKYELVEDVRDVHVRFAAYYRNGDDGGDTHTQVEWKKLSILHWAQLLSSNNDRAPQLADELTQVIVRACPSYDAFFFEAKGASYNNAPEKQFEFILVNSHSFKRAEENPDPSAFKEHLDCGASETTMVCSFWSLRGDARLIAPRYQNGEDLKKYSHLAMFLRNSSEEQRVQMWSHVTDEYLNILKEHGGKPVWLSTSGLGISWLHFRLDQVPKYYTFREFALEK